MRNPRRSSSIERTGYRCVIEGELLSHRYRGIGLLIFILGSALGAVRADEPLPVGSNPEPIAITHFPSRMHAFIWRNWQLVPLKQLAQVLKTEPEKIAGVAESMGLPRTSLNVSGIGKQGYITLVRRNWHLLPYDQLLELIGMSQEEFAFRLVEDDFLFVKLGQVKPRCDPLHFHEPTEAEQQGARRIKELIESHFGKAFGQLPPERPFAFIQRLSELPDREGEDGMADPNRAIEGGDGAPLRLIYSYFGSYGDPLNNPQANPYPDGLLARLASVGVNGVWLHVVLRKMAPGGETFPEFGEGHQTRLQNLRELCQRAQRFGIGVYLYLNEPRAMESSFFLQHPGLAGVSQNGLTALCTSDDRVREWVGDAAAHIFREVPELAGAFTITASENLTNCFSCGGGQQCPRCSRRGEDEVIAEINQVIEEGIHRGNPRARVIVWDWGWHRHTDACSIIRHLSPRVSLMSVSEWSKPIVRGGIATEVGEYSLSAVGPGPRAMRHWQAAREKGLPTVAKVQFNTTWELAAVPYLPTLDLVARHCQNLRQQQVDGQMLSWTVGGYPSPNLEVAHQFSEVGVIDAESVLNRVATRLYGANAAPQLRQAWTCFSQGLEEFPLHGSVLYNGPQQMGPANLLYWRPTGYSATMVGFPYDDLAGWRGPYPEEIFAQQFRLVADGWQKGLSHLKLALAAADPDRRAMAEADFRVAEAAGIHFRSVANQARFVRLRNTWIADGGLSREHRTELDQLLDDEIRLAQRLWELARIDSRIGFEASNHYFYVPQDLAEKVISCEEIKRRLNERID